MRFDIYENGKKIKQLSFFEFIDFYYDEFGSDCGNPSAVAQSLEMNQGTYVGKGYTVYKTEVSEAEQYYTRPATQDTKTETQCRHPNKYLNIITNSLQFWVCPDCKKEV
jgi:hypothetical protein